MRVEQVTVTDSPTSIKSLMESPRASNATEVQSKCTVITFKYAKAETAVVQISDAETNTPVTILDNVTEGISACSFENFELEQVLLSTVTGSVAVDIVVSQSS